MNVFGWCGKANTAICDSVIRMLKMLCTHKYRLMVEKFIELPNPDQPDWLLHLCHQKPSL